MIGGLTWFTFTSAENEILGDGAGEIRWASVAKVSCFAFHYTLPPTLSTQRRYKI